MLQVHLDPSAAPRAGTSQPTIYPFKTIVSEGAILSGVVSGLWSIDPPKKPIETRRAIELYSCNKHHLSLIPAIQPCQERGFALQTLQKMER